MNENRLTAKWTGMILVLILVVLAGLILLSARGKNTRSVGEIPTPSATLDVPMSVTETIGMMVAETQTSAPTATATITPLPPTPTPFVLPESHYIVMSGHHQYFGIGCEASAAVDWANYFDVQIYEYNFQHELPLSDNPDLGFVGDANGPWGQVPPYAYGVHAAPVAELLRKYGLNAVGEKNLTLEQVKESLAQSRPVIAWVIGNMVGGIPYEYTDSKGNKTIVAAYEHVVILTGYNATTIRYLNNGKFYEVPTDVFLNSWSVLGNMAVMLE